MAKSKKAKLPKSQRMWNKLIKSADKLTSGIEDFKTMLEEKIEELEPHSDESNLTKRLLNNLEGSYVRVSTYNPPPLTQKRYICVNLPNTIMYEFGPCLHIYYVDKAKQFADILVRLSEFQDMIKKYNYAVEVLLSSSVEDFLNLVEDLKWRIMKYVSCN